MHTLGMTAQEHFYSHATNFFLEIARISVTIITSTSKKLTNNTHDTKNCHSNSNHNDYNNT